MYAQGEKLRKQCMQTFTDSVELVAEEQQYTDNDALFFFRKLESAREFFNYAVGIGLAEGEVVLDPSIDPTCGVGGYAVRLMPHVKDTKPEVMLALFRRARGVTESAAAYQEWMEETGGALEVELAEMQVNAPSPDQATSGNLNRSSAPSVHSMTAMTGGGPTDVHAMTQQRLGNAGSASPETQSFMDKARATFAAAQSGNPAPGADLVHDGTNGMHLDPGGGATSNSVAQGDGLVSGKFGVQSEFVETDRRLSEELAAIGLDTDLNGIKQLCGN